MRDYLQAVRLFHQKFNHPAPEKVQDMIEEKYRLLRRKLILEEAAETIHALNGKKVDIVELADGLCDTIYVAAGGLVLAGYQDPTYLPIHPSEHNINDIEASMMSTSSIVRSVQEVDYHIKHLPPFSWLKPLNDLIQTCVYVGELYKIPMDECFDEVQRSNMAKLWADGKAHYTESGKVAKPPDWTPPNLKAILLARGIV